MPGDKMEKLLYAAAKVIGEKGFAQAKMADIADAAGIGKGTIYEYCRSKEELLEKLMEYHLEQAAEEMAALDMNAHPVEIIKTLIRRGLDVMEKMKDAITLTVDFWSAAFKNKESKIHAMLRGMYNEMIGLIEQVITAGQQAGLVRPECDARYFGMMLFSILDESFMHVEFEIQRFDRGRFEEETCRMVDAYLNPQGTEVEQ